MERLIGHDGDILIITDDGVPKSILTRIEQRLNVRASIIFPAGEANKNMTTFMRITDRLEALHATTGTLILAVGGGVVSDVAGFVAATFKRGLPLVIVSTTLLGMVDAAIGGKFAVNTCHSKNTIGTFYTPRSVIIDPDTLSTLPKRQIANGMAEIIKTALIGSETLFHQLNTSYEHLDISHIIKQAIVIKQFHIDIDPLDKGIRKQLNFGHTIGHALEMYHGHRYLHGECVAKGLTVMASEKDYETELHEILRKHNLEITIPYDKESLLEIIRHDKKIQGDTIDVIEVERPGNPFIKRIYFKDFENYL